MRALALCLILAVTSTVLAEEPKPKAAESPTKVRTVRVAWKPVDGASGYVVFYGPERKERASYYPRSVDAGGALMADLPGCEVDKFIFVRVMHYDHNGKIDDGAAQDFVYYIFDR